VSIIVADIGGTNARFATVDEAGGPLVNVARLRCGDYPTIGDALHAYCAMHDRQIAHGSDQLVIAVAGPVFGPTINFTNNDWSFDKAELRAKTGARSLLVINDFTAQALAQSANDSPTEVILDGVPKQGAPLLVIGPGTGLGVSALMPVGDDQIPVVGEGGHVIYSPVTDDDRALAAFLWPKDGHLIAEDVISGPGLENIYRFITRNNPDAPRLTAAEIGTAAIAHNGPERDAAIMLLDNLGSAIANAVVMMGCWRGVVIAGGVAPHLQPLFAQSNFANRFRNDGSQRDALCDIPVWLSIDPDAGLRGAVVAADNPHMQNLVITDDN